MGASVMATRQKRNGDVPFEMVQRIVDEPLEMARRLDFADWLEKHGQRERARWIRNCCAR